MGIKIQGILKGPMCSDSTMIGLQAIENTLNQTCWLMDPKLVIHMIVSNTGIALAYLGIPILLLYLLKVFYKYMTTNFKVVFIGFIAFILACMVTHVIKVANFWLGNFTLEIIADYIAAVVSLATMFTLYVAVHRIHEAIKENPEVIELAKPILVVLGITAVRKLTAVEKLKEGGSKVSFEDIEGLTFKYAEVGEGCWVKHEEVVSDTYIILRCKMDIEGHIELHSHDDYDEGFNFIKGTMFDDTNKEVVKEGKVYKATEWHSFYAVTECEMLIHCKKVIEK